jgi:RNA recognition motif-containing protein
MTKKIYVGNLNYRTTEDELRDLFSQYGAVSSARIIMDRATGRSKGFGFIEMDDDQEAGAAIAALNSKEFSGRQLKVNEANERPERPARRDNPRW